MCHICEDLDRTIRLLDHLAAYIEDPGHDDEFADTLGFGLDPFPYLRTEG